MPLEPPRPLLLLAVTLAGLVFVPGSLSTVAAEASDPLEIALGYLDENAAELDVTKADVSDLFVTSSYRSAHSGVTHVNLNQRFRELEVFGGHVTVNVAADRSVIFAGGSLARDLASASGSAELAPTEAVEAAADALDLAEPAGLRVLQREQRAEPRDGRLRRRHLRRELDQVAGPQPERLLVRARLEHDRVVLEQAPVDEARGPPPSRTSSVASST